jgi:hypothetical protein
MTVRKRVQIDPDELTKAAADPANRWEDLARMFKVSIPTLQRHLEALNVKKVRATMQSTGGPEVPSYIKPNDPGLAASNERKEEIKELAPWPKGIWFG